MFSVNALFYGNYGDLTTRCLDSLELAFHKAYVSEFRFGLNACSTSTRNAVTEFAKKIPVTCYLYAPVGNLNVGKYTLMRRMFYDENHPIMADNLMWFDDDSFYSEDSSITNEAWWQQIENKLKLHSVLGSLYFPSYIWNDKEEEAIKAQPWYTGVNLKQPPSFATGGWWAAKKDFLAKWDYPFKALHHNGGDVLLGELCRQQSTPEKQMLCAFKTNMKINADSLGRESRSKRRGMTTNRPYLNYPNLSESQHNFFTTCVEIYSQ